MGSSIDSSGLVMSPVVASVAASLATDPKIDPALANQAIGAVGETQIATVHVIAYGEQAAAALTDAGASDVQQLDLIAGASGTVAALQLSALAGDSRIDMVVIDSPVT
ncbi:MAG TPA: hypothetical protein VNY33_06000, partial [Gaiellaceae bacterium]|nr:hypothetical protein [Gaiellaceae bacterium]